MNDVVSTFHEALVAATAAGQPLNALAGKLFRDGADFANSGQAALQDPPFAWLRVFPSVPLGTMKGSRWDLMSGRVEINIAQTVASHADDEANKAAREAVETLRDAFMSVLMGLTYSAGTWDDLTVSAAEAGQGNVPFSGEPAWGVQVTCDFRFARYRAA